MKAVKFEKIQNWKLEFILFKSSYYISNKQKNLVIYCIFHWIQSDLIWTADKNKSSSKHDNKNFISRLIEVVLYCYCKLFFVRYGKLDEKASSSKFTIYFLNVVLKIATVHTVTMTCSGRKFSNSTHPRKFIKNYIQLCYKIISLIISSTAITNCGFKQEAFEIE